VQIVISQSMYFPWVGFLEQLRLADVFVVYDDVQYSKGSFSNRVQIKTPKGPRWLTVPLYDLHLGQKIEEVRIDNRQEWRVRHRDMLEQAYYKAPFAADMLKLVDSVLYEPLETLSELAYSSTMAMASYFGLTADLKIHKSSHIGIGGNSTQRVLDIVRHLNGKVYITGHGARNYLDHNTFELANIHVRYMQYCRTPYPQLHGVFNPFITALDLVANCGREGAKFIHSPAIYWKDFLHEKT
jgi:hypothetical protein